MLAPVVVAALAGCTTPGGPTSPDPVRFGLDGDTAACRIVFGPVAPDPAVDLEEVGAIDTPDGPTLLRRGPAADDRGAADLEIDGIDVFVSSTGGVTEAVWQLPPDEIVVLTRSFTEDELRALLPSLVATADTSQLAQTLADRIDGADVRYAGSAPRYDVGVSDEDAALAVAGRGVSSDRLDALYAVVGGEQIDGEAGWRTETGGVERRASDATVVIGSGRQRVAVSSDEFAATVEDLLGDGEPTVAVSSGRSTPVAAGCERPDDDRSDVAATVSAVEIVESDVGDLLRVTFDGLPDDAAEAVLVHVAIGGVELVGTYDGGDTVEFPATLTHAESRLLAERLAP